MQFEKANNINNNNSAAFSRFIRLSFGQRKKRQG